MIPAFAVPSGPPDTRPPNKPGTPPPPPKGEFAVLFAAVDAILDDLKTPARRDLSSVAVGVTPAVATTGGPVKPRAGGPPAPGADFRLPRDVRPGAR